MRSCAAIGKQIAKVNGRVCGLVFIQFHAVGEHGHDDPAVGFLGKIRFVDSADDALGYFLISHKTERGREAKHERRAVFPAAAAKAAGIGECPVAELAEIGVAPQTGLNVSRAINLLRIVVSQERQQAPGLKGHAGIQRSDGYEPGIIHRANRHLDGMGQRASASGGGTVEWPMLAGRVRRHIGS